MNQVQLVALLKDLQSYKECEWIEFKVNNSNPEEIGEYLSAVSNGARYHDKQFGYLVYGIDDTSQNLVGTSFKPKDTKKGNQEIENWLATLLNPRVDFSIYEFEHEGMHFAIFRVDAANNTPVKFKNIAYIRIGSYKKLLSDHPERERKIWDIKTATTFEQSIAIERITSGQILSYLDCYSYYEMMKLPLPSDINGVIPKLIEEKFILPNEGNTYDITNLAALLFPRKINLFETVNRKAVRVILYQGSNRVQTKKEQLGTRGYANAFTGVIDYISGHLPSSEIIAGGIRKEILAYPQLAIRELVANALIHQDFSIKGASPMIEIFDNRIEITNPGKPLIDPRRFMDHSPESRNEVLARFMRRLGICEERGSGIDKVVRECEAHKLPAPDFVAGDNFMRVILYGPTPLRQLDKKDKIQSCYLVDP